MTEEPAAAEEPAATEAVAETKTVPKKKGLLSVAEAAENMGNLNADMVEATEKVEREALARDKAYKLA